MNERLFQIGVKALIRNRAGEILILKANVEGSRNHKEPYWDLPGGRIKEGEQITETLAREVAEETGLKGIGIGRLFDVALSNRDFIIRGTDQRVWLAFLFYECSLRGDKEKITLSDEHMEYRWVSAQKAREMLSAVFPASFKEKL